tara:strand:+ start:2306 stop:2446 length:141 start_codon:yes stop_codon:yes gene_type:complete
VHGQWNFAGRCQQRVDDRIRVFLCFSFVKDSDSRILREPLVFRVGG